MTHLMYKIPRWKWIYHCFLILTCLFRNNLKIFLIRPVASLVGEFGKGCRTQRSKVNKLQQIC